MSPDKECVIEIQSTATCVSSFRWVFKQLHEKGLVYQGFRVMPYSTKCLTPLSNFEANQNYKDVVDPAGIYSQLVCDHNAV